VPSHRLSCTFLAHRISVPDGRGRPPTMDEMLFAAAGVDAEPRLQPRVRFQSGAWTVAYQ